MARTFSYTKAKVDTNLLMQEIRNSVIIVDVKSIDTVSTSIVVEFRGDISNTEETILDSVVANHDVSKAKIEDHEVDHQNKLFVHQSSRPLGTDTFYTGEDDFGQILSFFYTQGKFTSVHQNSAIETDEEDPEKDKSCSAYYEFNTFNNDTYLHEAIVQWEKCRTEFITCQIVPKVTPTIPGSYTNWYMYPNGVIVPSEAHGNIELAGQVCPIEMTPDQDTGIRTPGYWDIEYNEDSTDFDYTTLAFNPDGEGVYNLFGMEVPLASFVRRIPLLGSTSSWNILPSSDTAKIGKGMRIKMKIDASVHTPDHDFIICISFIMHRQKI